jgi:triphosphoribosyl-dephospho-CoA synthetase
MSETVEIINELLGQIKERAGIEADNLTEAIEQLLDIHQGLQSTCDEYRSETLAWIRATACIKPEHVEAYSKVQSDTLLALQEKVKRLTGEKADLEVYNKVLIKSGYLPDRVKVDAQTKMNNARQAREGDKV